MTFMSSRYGQSQKRLSSLIASFIGNDVVNQEQSFIPSQVITQPLDPIIQAISQFYQYDVRISPKPLLTPVRNIVSQHGAEDDNVLEIIKVLLLEQV